MAAQRETILRAALHCISEFGIERTSIAAIRKQSGLSAGALYTHFENKDAIIGEALRFASTMEWSLPDTWPEFVRAIAGLGGDQPFDLELVARTQLQVFATAIRPGPQHDLLKPLIDKALQLLVQHLTAMEAAGRIKLRLPPLRTALAIAAIRDGMLWSSLALDRSHEALEADMTAALYCFIEV
jgi:AcrR family transcriptional regulator